MEALLPLHLLFSIPSIYKSVFGLKVHQLYTTSFSYSSSSVCFSQLLSHHHHIIMESPSTCVASPSTDVASPSARVDETTPSTAPQSTPRTRTPTSPTPTTSSNPTEPSLQTKSSKRRTEKTRWLKPFMIRNVVEPELRLKDNQEEVMVSELLDPIAMCVFPF
jgi:hypothetical protein